MNSLKRNLSIAVVGLALLSSCKEKPLAPDEMKDAAGNRYKTVVIGNQLWMAENLHALYINVPNNSSNLMNAIEADFWYPDDTPAKMPSYGLLYPFDGARALLPKDGWRIPTLNDIDRLLRELGVNYERGSDAVVRALNINFYPGSNDGEIFTIDKYFSLLLDAPPTSISYDYRTLRIHAIDFPDDDPPIYWKTVYLYNATRGFASSVRFVKDIE